MTFDVRTERRPNTLGLEDTVWVLGDPERGVRAEIWPAHGFNCYRWSLARAGRIHEILFSLPEFFTDNKPTRSGIPVLFPFPNRIRAGHFCWDGTSYELPRNDPSGQNAIHGFACRNPWRVIAHGADQAMAWITGEFHGVRDAPASRGFWPADHRLQLTYRLTPVALILEARVDNPDGRPLPFGLGFHPYFRVEDGDSLVQAAASAFWELDQSLPTGKRRPIDAARDLRSPRPFRTVSVDDVLCDLDGSATAEGLRLLGRVSELRLSASQAFRELVAFTPPHRQAMCLEPYTCTTDAINLHARGLDAGLLVLPPGQSWTAVVDMTVENSRP